MNLIQSCEFLRYKPNTIPALQSLEVIGQNGPVKVGDIATITGVSNGWFNSSCWRIDMPRWALVWKIQLMLLMFNVQLLIDKGEYCWTWGVWPCVWRPRWCKWIWKIIQELFLAIALSILVTYIVFVVFLNPSYSRWLFFRSSIDFWSVFFQRLPSCWRSIRFPWNNWYSDGYWYRGECWYLLNWLC